MRANGYLVAGRCECGELLTKQAFQDSRGQPCYVHVTTYRQECAPRYANLVEPVDEPKA